MGFVVDRGFDASEELRRRQVLTPLLYAPTNFGIEVVGLSAGSALVEVLSDLCSLGVVDLA